MGSLREGLGRLGYRSVTHPEARPGPDDLGALLAAIPFSSDRAVLAPYRGFRAIRLRQSAEDHAIGNVVADAGFPALVLERHLHAGQIVRPILACGIRRPVSAATCCDLTGSARPQKTDRTFMYKLWAPQTPMHRSVGRPSRAGSACSG